MADPAAAPSWKVHHDEHVRLGEFDPGATAGLKNKRQAGAEAKKDLRRLRTLQEQLHVDGRTAVLLVLQGMDTSGKDGMVRHLAVGLSLVGAEMTAFAASTPLELRQIFSGACISTLRPAAHRGRYDWRIIRLARFRR